MQNNVVFYCGFTVPKEPIFVGLAPRMVKQYRKEEAAIYLSLMSIESGIKFLFINICGL